MVQLSSSDAYCLFCEDVRQELGERLTLVGVFKSHVKFSRFPTLMPKLGFYVNIRDLPQKRIPNTMKLQMHAEWSDKLVVDITVDEKAIEQLRADRKKEKSNKGGIIMNGVISPFEVPAPGLLTVKIIVGRTIYDCGSVKFIQST